MVCPTYDQGTQSILPEANHFCETPGNSGIRLVVTSLDGYTGLVNGPLNCKNGKASFTVPSNVLFYPDDFLRWSLQTNKGEEICSTTGPAVMNYGVCE